MTQNLKWVGMILLVLTVQSPETQAEDQTQLAQELQNPIADLISMPVQNNWDFGIGPADAMRYTANVQPVIPFELTEDWILITRTIMPVIHAESPVEGGRAATGLGDILQSFFLSPAFNPGGWTVGVGPAILYPSATDNLLGGQKWAVGPTAVALQQRGGFTYGMLANHLWSFAGSDRRQNVNSTFMQPFLVYTTHTHTSFALATETIYDWTNDEGTLPLNVSVSQLLKVGSLPLQVQFGPRWYATRPSGGPDWGLRFTLTLILPEPRRS